MSLKIPMDWEIYRRAHPLDPSLLGDRHNGMFRFPKRELTVMCSNGGDWEHVSVSLANRTPTWEELEWVKRELWHADDTVMQLHVAVSEHKNCHPYTLHLWRPLIEKIPLPPSMMVAP